MEQMGLQFPDEGDFESLTFCNFSCFITVSQYVSHNRVHLVSEQLHPEAVALNILSLSRVCLGLTVITGVTCDFQVKPCLILSQYKTAV